MSKRFIYLILAALVAVAVLAGCGKQASPAPATEVPMQATEASAYMGKGIVLPAGVAYAEGQEIRFMHTEVSDPDVAKLLSDMMSSPVLYVPSLAQAAVTVPVYVFKNGGAGMGPLGFQADVFGDLPGTDSYTPLRKIVFATWTDAGKARELKSVSEILEAQKNGEVTLEQSNVVVNMPFVIWPGGKR
jgi:hypothetical protein